MTATLPDNRRGTTDIRRSSFIAHRISLGFTLVEMLVVITIIGILASLATVAAYKALEAAKRARITAELANLDGAVKAYKEKFGDYPPCVSTIRQSPASNTTASSAPSWQKRFRDATVTEMNASKRLCAQQLRTPLRHWCFG